MRYLAPRIVSYGRLWWKTLHMALFSCPDMIPVMVSTVSTSTWRAYQNLGWLLHCTRCQASLTFLLVLPMGWKNSPPVFSTATETLTDLANQGIHYPMEPKAHQLNDQAEAASLQGVGNMPNMSSSSNTTPIPAALDPSLSEMHEPLSYIDEFVDDSVGLAQTRSTAWWVPKFYCMPSMICSIHLTLVMTHFGVNLCLSRNYDKPTVHELLSNWS